MFFLVSQHNSVDNICEQNRQSYVKKILKVVNWKRNANKGKTPHISGAFCAKPTKSGLRVDEIMPFPLVTTVKLVKPKYMATDYEKWTIVLYICVNIYNTK